MKKVLLVLSVLISLFLTGCSYNVSNNINIKDEDSLTNDIWVTNQYLYEDQAPDMKTLISYLIDLDKYEVKSEENFLGLESKQLKFSELKYIKKTVVNGITTLEIKIPPLVAYKNSDDEYEGATFYTSIFLDKKFEYIESNSMDIESKKEGDYITWTLAPKILARGTTLTLKYKKK